MESGDWYFTKPIVLIMAFFEAPNKKLILEIKSAKFRVTKADS
jgi:hypothetical protein